MERWRDGCMDEALAAAARRRKGDNSRGAVPPLLAECSAFWHGSRRSRRISRSVDTTVWKLRHVIFGNLLVYTFINCTAELWHHDSAFVSLLGRRGRGAKYCQQRLSVCLSVRSRTSKTTCPKFAKFSVRSTCGRSVFLWWQCNTLCTSGLWMTSWFHTMEQKCQNQRRRMYVYCSSSGGGTGLVVDEVCL